MELLARLVLNRVRVVLEALDMLLDAGVFVLKLLDLVLELPFLVSLAIPGGRAVAAVDDTPCEGESQGDGEHRAGGAPAPLKPLNGSLRQRKRRSGRFLFFTEQIWVLHSASVNVGLGG